MTSVSGSVSEPFNYFIVYNTFVWPTPTPEQKEKIESTAREILDARSKYHGVALANLYGDDMHLYSALVKAHQNNDRAVMQAYGMSIRDTTESSCVAELMKLYQARTEGK